MFRFRNYITDIKCLWNDKTVLSNIWLHDNEFKKSKLRKNFMAIHHFMVSQLELKLPKRWSSYFISFDIVHINLSGNKLRLFLPSGHDTVSDKLLKLFLNSFVCWMPIGLFCFSNHTIKNKLHFKYAIKLRWSPIYSNHDTIHCKTV